jgi:predicted neuraminidase
LKTIAVAPALAALTPLHHSLAQGAPAGVVKSEFVFDRVPFPSCHASTICESDGALVCAWFAGTREKARDVGIWLSRYESKGWSEPVEVANGRDEDARIQYACWNPVLHQARTGPMLLFYKVGPSPSEWWGMLITSNDGGKTWSEEKRLPKNIFGPIKNKPIELMDGTLLCGSSTEDAGWRVHVEKSRTFGKNWTRSAALNSALDYGAIQPTLLAWKDGRIQMLCRTKQDVIIESWSRDNANTWTRFVQTSLPNPNAGFDAVMLRDGRALLVYNHSTEGRGVLNVAISRDGRNWQAATVLENEPGSEFSYPAVIQTPDGMVHVTYTWKRQRIKHVVLDPERLNGRDIVSGIWPG